MEEILKKAPKWINKSIEFCAKITLQIYLVQFVIIYKLESLAFPLNFIATTFTILIAASVIYFVELAIRKETKKIVDKIKRGEGNAKGKD